jgi:hypothetical protein
MSRFQPKGVAEDSIPDRAKYYTFLRPTWTFDGGILGNLANRFPRFLPSS